MHYLKKYYDLALYLPCFNLKNCKGKLTGDPPHCFVIVIANAYVCMPFMLLQIDRWFFLMNCIAMFGVVILVSINN